MGDVKIGQTVELSNGLIGKIVFDGAVDNKGTMIGLELEEWSIYGCDGSNNGKFYFSTPPGYGYFSTTGKVSRVLKRKAAPAKKKQPAPAVEDSPFVSVGRRDQGGIAIGDKVELRNRKQGTIQYIKGDLVGLVLTNWSEKGHDGTVKGKTYFKCKPGYGYFTKREAIVRTISKAAGGIGAPDPSTPVFTPQDDDESDDLMASVKPAISISIGDKVQLARGRVGIVKYIGRVDFLKGAEVVGLELEQWSQKGHDGLVKGKRYFTCQAGRGYFTKKDNVTKVMAPAAALEKERQDLEEQRAMLESPRGRGSSMMSNSFEDEIVSTAGEDIQIGDQIQLRKGRKGYVRYIGKVSGMKGEVVGMELLQWDIKGHNGDGKDGKHYFDCKDGTGYWTTRKAVSEILKSAAPVSSYKPVVEEKRQSKSTQDDMVDVAIGDLIRLKRGREGVVQYIGKEKNPILGVELSQWSSSGNDGSLKDKRYFTCDMGRGYFSRQANVATVIKRNTPEREDPRTMSDRELFPSYGSSKSSSSAPTANLVNFKVGDRVRLQRGRVGTVKFYGKVEFAVGDVVGLELEQWSEKGNDGSVKGKRYFETRGPGWGYFTKPSAIAEVIFMP